MYLLYSHAPKVSVKANISPRFFSIFNYTTISCIYLFLTPNSRSVFRAGVSLNIHSFIHSFFPDFAILFSLYLNYLEDSFDNQGCEGVAPISDNEDHPSDIILHMLTIPHFY